jgi:peptidoglycan/xylan/chitin deacetylase (PgdA/CDA1 family)
MDDITEHPSQHRAEELMQTARAAGDAALFHMHEPGVTVSLDAVDRILANADEYGLDFVTYDELVPGDRRPAMALAFDDTAVDLWYGIRDRLAAHGARVTFFVTRWDTIGQPQRDELRELHDLGHDVEPHTVNHVHAPAYVAEHGMDAYLADEVLPSIEAMRDAGYPPTTLAFPYGETTPEITAAVLEHIDRVRIGPGTCPNR